MTFIYSPPLLLLFLFFCHLYRQEHTDEISKLISKCFPDFGLTADGTPTHAEHFCMCLRQVTKQWKIVEVVIRCRAYKGSFDLKTLAGTLLNILEEQYKLKLEHWRCFMADRAATNTAALRAIIDKVRLNVLEVPCISHGLNNGGKAFKTPNLDYVLKKLNALVKFKMCKARDVWKKCFGENPLKSGGVRWWMAYEQAEQASRLGLDRIADQYVKECHRKQYSKISAKKLSEFLDDAVSFSRAVVEMAAVVDAGRKMVQLTYIAESSAPMVLVFYPLINQLVEECREGGNQSFERLNESCDLAAMLMEQEMESMLLGISEAVAVEITAATASDEARRALKSKEEEFLVQQEHQQQQQESTRLAVIAEATRQQAEAAQAATVVEEGRGTRGARGAGRRLNYANMHNGRVDGGGGTDEAVVESAAVEHEQVPLPDIKETLEYKSSVEADTTTKAATKAVTDAEALLTEFQANNLCTHTEFFQHGLDSVEPGIEYVLKKFGLDDGPYYNLMCLMRAAQLFNPQEAKGKTQQWLNSRAGELTCFGFPQFLRDSFMSSLKGELPKYGRLLLAEFDWDEAIEGSKEYNKKLAVKNLKSGEEKTWLNDPGEVARRAFGWWGVNHHKLPFLAVAVRLVVLVQTSSAKVERVFSQLGLILDAIGVNALDETMELRLFERVNRRLYAQH
jgi:hypothetical protein